MHAMPTPRTAAGAALLLAALLPAAAAAQAKEYLYIENSAGGDVTVVSVPEHEVVSRIPHEIVGDSPDDVIGSNDGRFLFVNRLATQDIVIISTETEELVGRIPVGGTPHHITISDDDRYLFVPLFNQDFAEVVDIEKREVIAQVPTLYGGHDSELSHDGRTVYIGNILAPRITAFDATTHEVVKVIPTPEGVRPFKVSKDGKKIWSQLSKLHGFVEIDVEEARITKTVHFPTLGKMVPPEAFTNFPMTIGHGLVVSPDEKRIFVAATLYDFVAVLDLPSLDLVATIPTGKEPGWLAMSQDGRYVYSSNRGAGDHSLSVIDTRTLEEVKRIPKIGNFPQRMNTVIVPNRRVSATNDE